MNETKKSDDISVTKGMLDETRNELKSDISSLKFEMKAGFKSVDSKFKSVDSKFKSVDARFDKIDSKFDDVRSDIQALTASVHRALALQEEQEARNKYVLDGHQVLHDRQDKFEHEILQDVTEIKTVISKMNKTN